MSESDTWAALRPLMAPLDPHRIENLITAEKGMPDVEYVGGWAELKWIARSDWPKRARTVVRLDHYTDEQRNFLLRRWNFGEAAWLILQSGEEWFFWNAPAAQAVGTLTREQLQETATYYFKTKPTADQVCTILRKNSNSRIDLWQ